MKSTGYPLHSHVSPSLPLPCVTVCHQVSTELYLKATVRNVTQRAWWVLMRLCTNSGAVYWRSSFDDVVCLYYWVTLVLSVCTIYYWSGTSRSVMLAKKLTFISVVNLW